MSATQAKKAAISKIDELMQEAEKALQKTDYFQAEKAARQALHMAYEAHDYDRMARVLLPLQEARRQKRQAAADSGKIFNVDSYEQLEKIMRGGKNAVCGCYVVEPPLVGADGRMLRDRLDELAKPAIVVVREPKTQLGLWPVVMIGPITVRTRVKPPKKLSVQWVLAAGEALGDEAISSVDGEMAAADRVTAFMERLATVVDHEKLCQALGEACKHAEREAAEEALKPKKTAPRPAEEDEGFGEDAEDEI